MVPIWNLSFCLPSWTKPKTQPGPGQVMKKDRNVDHSHSHLEDQQQLSDSSDDETECSAPDTNASVAAAAVAAANVDKRRSLALKTTYYIVRRDDSVLLKYAWQRLWRQVLMRCHTHPSEAWHLTQFSQRTSLHLVTVARTCPLDVARELIEYNRHALLLCDRQGYTPLHNVCALGGSKDMVALLCDQAMKVERDMLMLEEREPSTSRKAKRWDKPNWFFAGVNTLPQRRTFQTPLMLAAKSGAAPGVFRLLLDTRHMYRNERFSGRRVGEWIAPWTGAEPYWDAPIATITMPPQYASPLEVLIQDRTHLLSLKHLRMDEDKRSRLRALFMTRFDKAEFEGEFVAVVRRDSMPTLWNSPHKLSTAVGDIDAISKFDYFETVDFEETVQLWRLIMEFFAEYLSPPLGYDEKDDEKKGRPLQTGLLHAVASLTTPNPTLFELILDIFGAEDATRRDERQMLPLHHALLALQLYNHSIPESSLTDRFVVYRQKQYQLIVSLLIQAPQPAEVQDRHFPNGQTSLVRALEARAPMALLDELLAKTNELEIVDVRSKLYPFAVAASLDYELSDVYALLLRCPQVLQNQ